MIFSLPVLLYYTCIFPLHFVQDKEKRERRNRDKDIDSSVDGMEV